MKNSGDDESSGISIYYPGSEIQMYRVNLEPVNSNCPYGLARKAVINFMRKRSGLCARVNDDALEGIRGSAAMIDYIMRERLYGNMDAKFMYGSVDAVRSRVRTIQGELVNLAKKYLESCGTFRMFEAGHGFIRTKIQLIKTLKNESFDISRVELIGCDINPQVVEVVRKIIAHEGLDDLIRVYEGNAIACLDKLGQSYDACLAEGVFEYMNMDESIALAQSFHKHLTEGGMLIATATHTIPKVRIAKLLDFWFEPRQEEDFIKIFREAGFREPRLIKTNPPNISVGMGRKE